MYIVILCIKSKQLRRVRFLYLAASSVSSQPLCYTEHKRHIRLMTQKSQNVSSSLTSNLNRIHFLGNTPQVILGSQSPSKPISEIGPGSIWWSIHFDQVVRNEVFWERPIFYTATMENVNES